MEHPVCDQCRKILDEACRDNSVWYGYLHVNGTSHLKRIASTDDWEEAFNSDFVEKISRPFVATGRKDAQEIIKEMLNQHEKMVYMLEWLANQLKGKTLMAKAGADRDFGCEHKSKWNYDDGKGASTKLSS